MGIKAEDLISLRLRGVGRDGELPDAREAITGGGIPDRDVKVPSRALIVPHLLQAVGIGQDGGIGLENGGLERGLAEAGNSDVTDVNVARGSNGSPDRDWISGART